MYNRLIVSLTRAGVNGGKPLNISNRVMSLSYSDSEEQSDYAIITVDDFDLWLLDSPIVINDTNTVVSLTFGDSTAMFKTVNLLLVKTEPVFANEGIKLVLEAMDKGTLLTGVNITRTWKYDDVKKFLPAERLSNKDIKASDIIKVIADNYKMGYAVEETEELKREWVQSNISDMDFVEELRRNAISFIRGVAGGAYRAYVETTKNGSTLHFHGIYYGDKSSITYGWKTTNNVISFTPSVEKQEIAGAAFEATQFVIGAQVITGEVIVSKISGVTMVRNVADNTHLLGINEKTKQVGIYDLAQNKLPWSESSVIVKSYLAKNPLAYSATTGQSAEVADYSMSNAEVAVEKDENGGLIFNIWGDYRDKVGSDFKITRNVALGGGITPTVEESEVAASKKLQEMQDLESKAVKGELIIKGDVNRVAGQIITLEGFGKLFSGKWYVSEATHTIDDKGYLTTLKLNRNSIGVKDTATSDLPSTTAESGDYVTYDAKTGATKKSTEYNKGKPAEDW